MEENPVENQLGSNFIDQSANRVLIAQNPKSGSGNRTKLIQRLTTLLEEAGQQVETFQSAETLFERARDLYSAGSLRAVVSAGGDGTVSLLVNHLPAAIPIFVFPLGTANLLAKYLKSTRDAARAVKTILGGRTIVLDVGKANDRLFLVVASCGYDAEVVHQIHARRTGHIHYGSYAIPMIQSLIRYRFPLMDLVADGQKLKEARWAFVLNLPKYAMGLNFTPEANAQDGKLDLCSFSQGGLFSGIGYFLSVLLGRHQKLATSQLKRFETLQIRSSTEHRVPLELDGDPAGFLPATITTVPKRLRVIVSENWKP